MSLKNIPHNNPPRSLHFIIMGIALLGGASLTTAFSPLNQSNLAFLLPGLLLYIILSQSKKQAFLTGLCWGIGFFGVGVSWVYVSIHTFGNTPVPLALLITALFILVLALFFALQAWLFSTTQTWPAFIRCVVVFPLLWVLQEYIRARLFTGFPWLLLAYTQTNGSLTQIIASHAIPWSFLYSDEAITGIITIFSGLLAWLGLQNSRSYRIPMMAMIMSMVILYKIDLLPLTTHPEKTRSLRIALVQSNIPEKERWVPEALDNIINIHQYLTDSIESADLIVWPEAAIPESEDHIQPLLTKIQSEQKKRQRYLISGLITTDYHGHYYNGLRLFGNDNNPPNNAYRKYHLVPFGEFLPFEKQLKGLIGFFDIPMSNLSPGPQYQPLLDVRGIKIAPFICYEIAYTDQLQHYLPEADLLLVISNDAWFGHSWAAEQHLQIARWRALQAHRTLLFASNDGITAVIDNHGKIIKQLKPFIRGILEEILLL